MTESRQLTQEEIKTRLNDLDNWNLIENKIEKEFNFESFENAMDFVNAVAKIANEEDHHPDILISYKKVVLSLITHKKGSLTEKDFDVAFKIEKIKINKF
jgi:4a-hydroxytetrahydrobiopterin dehydratase